MTKQREIVGVFVRERNVFLSADGLTRTIIGVIECKSDEPRFKDQLGEPQEFITRTIKGEAAEGELQAGLEYRWYGSEREHWKHGPQFVFDSFVVEKPAGQEAVTTYLQQCHGIGPTRAHKLWDNHKDDAIRFLREEPDAAADEIKIPYDSARTAADLLTQRLAVEKTTVELYGLLHGRGLPKFKKLVEKIIGDFGAQAATLIRRSPYILMRYPGIGFQKADKIYLELGPQKGVEKHKHAAKLKRQSLCIWNAINRNSSGDTWFRESVGLDALNENIHGTTVDFERAMTLATRSGLLSQRVDKQGRTWIADRRKENTEGRLARLIVAAMEETDEEGVAWPDLSDIDASEHQKVEIQKATRGIIGIFTGSPGTGKTRGSAEILKKTIQLFGISQIKAGAPTGKAAVRLTEALQKNKVDLRATTLHSMLGVMAGGDDGWSFQHDENNPLQCEVIVLDESSMDDVPLLTAVLCARSRGTHVLIVGDPNQLPPVGHGAPLRDLIKAGVPTGSLTEIWRNSGRVIKACAEIRDHGRFTASPKLDLDAGENLLWLERNTPEEQIETLTKLMNQFQSANPQKYDPIWDVQILVPVNKKSPLSRKTINTMLQDLLNPNGKRVEGNPFRVGDKLICNKNHWLPPEPEWMKEVLEFNGKSMGECQGITITLELPTGGNIVMRDSRIYVANGEQCAVLNVEPLRTTVRLSSPERVLIVPRGQRDKDETDDEDDKDESSGCNWELGLAISCHKSQGSSWKVVVMLADEYPGARMVQSKQYLITALSRIETFFVGIGKKSVADQMCKQDALFKRNTFLVERIAELRAKSPAKRIELAEPTDEPFDVDFLSSDLFGELLEGVAL